jgi:RNA polymerase sigma factor (sigma-70 family)
MNDSEPRELELTPDLIEYATAIALQEAKERCPKYVDYGDVVQEVLLHLISKPPKYDPTRGASAKTLIHTIVQRGVLKYVARQCRQAGRFKQVDEAKPEVTEDDEQVRPQRDGVERRTSDLTAKSSTTDDVLQFIDSEESRELCRTVIDCECNLSEAARRLGVAEGTVRYRLKMLAPKLIAAGFDPFNKEEFR